MLQAEELLGATAAHVAADSNIEKGHRQRMLDAWQRTAQPVRRAARREPLTPAQFAERMQVLGLEQRNG